MTVPIDESLLLGFMGMIFIPLFIFLIKMIITVGKIESRLDNLCQRFIEMKGERDNIVELQSDIRILKLRLDGMEEDISMLRGYSKYYSSSSKKKSGGGPLDNLNGSNNNDNV